MITQRTLSHTTAPINGTPFIAFAISEIYDHADTAKLEALARQYGASFVACDGGGCFVAHREVIGMHPDYVGHLLTDASNAGLLRVDCAAA